MIEVDVDTEHDEFVLRASLYDTDRIRQVPGARFKRNEQCWRLPCEYGAVLALGNIFGSDLSPTPQAKEAASSLSALAADLLATKEDSSPIEGLPHLYPFQAAGVRFLSAAWGALLADEMGTGKTVQALGALANLGRSATPVLVVCPNSMKYVWAEEAARWLPGWSVSVVDGPPKKRKAAIEKRADITIINWESLRLHTKLAGYGSLRVTAEEGKQKDLNLHGGPRTVIADEAHKAKDPTSKQTRALWGVSKGAKYRWALTGTPIANSPDDLWAIMRFVAPTEWPSKVAYLDRYCHLISNPWGGVTVAGLRQDTKDELFGFLDPRFLRRSKAEVLTELPDKVYQVRPVPMPPAQEKVYKQLAKHMMTKIQDELLVAADPLSLLTRLVQAASATPVLERRTDKEGREYVAVSALTDPSNKVSALLDIVNGELAGESAVVFAVSRKLIDLASAALYDAKKPVPHVRITGGQSPEERAAAIDKFQAGGCQLALVTLGAGSEGITLTKASRAIFLQRSWSLVQNKQAEDRIHRVGQNASSVEYIDLISPGTVEYAIRLTMLGKDQNLQEVVRDKRRLEALIFGEAGS